jgi:hypothetical protein
MHVAAALLHYFVRRDGVLQRLATTAAPDLNTGRTWPCYLTRAAAPVVVFPLA